MSSNRNELIAQCKMLGIKGYSGKKNAEIQQMILAKTTQPTPSLIIETNETNAKIHRLNYIGSKFQLLDWLSANILEKTGWSSFSGRTVGDIFAGTGVVSYHFRKAGATVISNDAELYSYYITHAFTRSVYTETCRHYLTEFQRELDSSAQTPGYVTQHYSPHNGNERKFFTVDNAQRIDYVRTRIESVRQTLCEDEYNFLLASLLISADAVSNVPAVYGCFLKNFKSKALKPLVLTPIHTSAELPASSSVTYHSDVLDPAFLENVVGDVVYLDPPYNERQYSKNYFPLNIIAKTPAQLVSEEPLKGKTGIPTDCFISPFCRRGAVAEEAFDTLFRSINAQWIFLSYNSESIVDKDRMLVLMRKYGDASVVEREYKRFKSFEYNQDVQIKEYLFCLRKK